MSAGFEAVRHVFVSNDDEAAFEPHAFDLFSFFEGSVECVGVAAGAMRRIGDFTRNGVYCNNR